MSGEQYTQVRRPLSRLAEKVLGWLSWLFLLFLTIATMFIALVSFSDDSSIRNLESFLNNNDLIQQILGTSNFNTTQFVIWLQNGIWALIVYLIICLLISFLALISMNIRILSGFLFLLAMVITLPLVVPLVTLIIPVLFFIIAIMMFARKDKSEIVPAHYAGNQHEYDSDYDYDYEPEADNHYKHQPTSDAYEDDHQDQQLRRGGYSSAVAEKVNSDYNKKDDDEPQVLSRQAKYNYKNKAQKDNSDDIENSKDEFGQVSNVYDEKGNHVETEEQRLRRQEAEEERQRQQQQQAEEEARRKQEEREEAQRRKQQEREEAARMKQQKAEEKERIKQEKKERKRRKKELRKQQPSAVNQRRMNFDERKKMHSHDSTQDENVETNSKTNNDEEK
ncbi:DUF4064 domain-containing protein [Staphylococcus sp. Marseille-Q5304]|uniref:lipoteichoic acid stability factor AuxB n=1 Tax=Staphylococcus sp. Marseille-Q5304 TaxID=2942200 RepID=UPI0020746E5A|nr:DUF4064 domain-containing protein [Staphylococcus sp. Marseille-Q5304]